MVTWSRLSVAGLAALGVLVGASGAEAQLRPRFRAVGLNDQDFAVLDAKTRSLYESDQTAIGQSASWSNPATGNSGTATLVRDLQLRGMACRNIRYDFSLTRPARQTTYSINWCHTPQNTWRIVD